MERITTFRVTQAGAATGRVRAAIVPVPGGDAASQPVGVRKLRFFGDVDLNVLLRTSPAGAAADTDFRGPYYIDATGSHEVVLDFTDQDGTLPMERDLHYAVVGAGNWTLEVVTGLR